MVCWIDSIRARCEEAGVGGGASEQFLHAENILLASADVWPVFIEQSLNLGFLTELSSHIVHRCQKHPNVDETTDGCASNGIHSLLHVIGQRVGHNNNEDILEGGSHGNDL